MEVILTKLVGIEKRLEYIDALEVRRESLNGDRHRENISRLDRIEAQVTATNGRVTRAEEQIKTLYRALKARVTGKHDTAGGDSEQVTLGRLRWYLACAAGGAALAWWAFMTFYVPYLQRVAQGMGS